MCGFRTRFTTLGDYLCTEINAFLKTLQRVLSEGQTLALCRNALVLLMRISGN